MLRFFVAGSGPGIGKTVVSAILTNLVNGAYWKPIECGAEDGFDTETMFQLLNPKKYPIYPSVYSLQKPFSPHHAARLENITIQLNQFILPATTKPLIIETAGGLLTPLTASLTNLDLFQSWEGLWIIVSRHYLGSINHTLLTVEALKYRKLSVLGIIFNGDHNPDSEEAILKISKLPLLGRLYPEKTIHKNIINLYVKRWKKQIIPLLHN